MKLLLDVGNTSTTWGVSELVHGKPMLTHQGYVDTHPLTSLGGRLQSPLKELSVKNALKEVWVASVVRGATPVLEKSFGTAKINRILPGNIQGIPNLTLEPEKVGIDRLVNAKAALREHKPPFIIVDSGTAITLCAINKKGEYLGGAILPGLELARNALSEKTSLLPSVEIRAPAGAPEESIGKNTEEALHTGIVLGAAHAIRGLYRDFAKQLTGSESPKPVTFIGTGGRIPLLARFIPELDHIDQNLTLKGIQEIAYE